MALRLAAISGETPRLGEPFWGLAPHTKLVERGGHERATRIQDMTTRSIGISRNTASNRLQGSPEAEPSQTTRGDNSFRYRLVTPTDGRWPKAPFTHCLPRAPTVARSPVAITPRSPGTPPVVLRHPIAEQPPSSLVISQTTACLREEFAIDTEAAGISSVYNKDGMEVDTIPREGRLRALLEIRTLRSIAQRVPGAATASSGSGVTQFSDGFIAEFIAILQSIATEDVEAVALGLSKVRARGGRLFILGVGADRDHRAAERRAQDEPHHAPRPAKQNSTKK